MTNRNEQRGEMASRPTIGMLVDTVISPGRYQKLVWRGVSAVAKKNDVNLATFVGGPLDYVTRRNPVYDLAGEDRLDGLLVLGNTIGNFVSDERLQGFYDQYAPLPRVSIGQEVEGVPGVLVDNQNGLRDGLRHLIVEHGYRRIGFIQGIEGSREAEQRYQAYRDALSEQGLPLDPDLVAPGSFTANGGIAAVELFIDQRQVEPDAIVAANDNMALGALDALTARGLTVPYDVALLGFDDISEARGVTPPLTTVRQPAYEQGRRAALLLLDLIAGRETTEQVVLPTELIVRQSCGCRTQASVSIDVESEAPEAEGVGKVFGARRDRILADMVGYLRPPESDRLAVTEWAARVLDTYIGVVAESREPVEFFETLDRVMRRVIDQEGDVLAWQKAITVLRTYTTSLRDGTSSLSSAIQLLDEAGMFVAEMAERRDFHRRLELESENVVLRDVSQRLTATFDMSELMDIVVEQLPRLGLDGCYISLYHEGDESIDQARLMLAYDQGRLPVDDEGNVFLASKIVPDGMLPAEKPYSLLVDALFFHDRQLGFSVLEVDPGEEETSELLRAQVSVALNGALLLQQLEERSKALQEANYALQRRAILLEASADVGRTITTIFERDELLRRTVDLIRDRFGFYHVGVFLIDESGEWAVLEEATGKAGEEMKADGHRLAVDDSSMVGWTANHQQARIALDADEDAVRFTHPLLPHTRSEMTLPLAVGGKLLGVLNVQSTDEAAFDEDDIRTLQSVADQVAVALENARRVADEAAMLETYSPVYRASRLLTTARTPGDVADAIIESVGETDADGCLVVEFEFAPNDQPEALLYRGVWRRDREPRFRAGLRLPIEESPFPLEMVSSFWASADVEADEKIPESARRAFVRTDVHALVNIPLRSGEEVIGQVVVLRSDAGPFKESDLQLYEALSGQAAVALERAQLLEEAQGVARQEQRAREMIDQIHRAADIDQALESAARQISHAMEVPHVAIELGLETVAEHTPEDTGADQ